MSMPSKSFGNKVKKQSLYDRMARKGAAAKEMPSEARKRALAKKKIMRGPASNSGSFAGSAKNFARGAAKVLNKAFPGKKGSYKKGRTRGVSLGVRG